MNGKKKVELDVIVEVYRKKAGNIAATCDACGITRRTFERHRVESQEFKEKIEEINESLIDMAESKLLQAINEGDRQCIMFMLKTKGKNRGYYEKKEVEATVDMDVNAQYKNLTTEELKKLAGVN